MEFLLSTKSFKHARKSGDIYFSPNFDIDDDGASLLDGYVLDDKNMPLSDFSELFNNHYRGCFNFITYTIKSGIIKVKNDKFGTWPLYVYQKGKHLAIGNNLWEIVQHVGKGELSISNRAFKQYFGTWGNDLYGRTLFEEIKELSAANIFKYNTLENKSVYEEYWTLDHGNFDRIELQDAVDLLDEDLTKTFDYFKKMHPDDVFCFGNSGGLDSRLVPIYASGSNLNFFGITIEDTSFSLFPDSVTLRNAREIAKLYHFKSTPVGFDMENHDERMLLDIRNNPFGTCEILKNPFDKIDDCQRYLTGGNGFIVGGGWAKYLKAKDDQTFKKIFIDNYNIKKAAFSWNNKGLALEQLFSKDDLEGFRTLREAFYEKNAHKDRISIIRSYHQYLLNKRSPSGGYESLSRTIPSYNIYYPIAFENTMRWKEDFFVSRSVLKEVIRKRSQELYSIPSQNLVRLDGENLKFKQKLKRRLELMVRRPGLRYASAVERKSFKNYYKKVMERRNDGFYGYFQLSPKDVLRLNLLENLDPLASLEILKLKRIFDLLEYDEMELLNKKEFGF